MAENVAGGYNGKILRVNLSQGKITEETIEETICRKYLGGAGFAFYYLWKELKPGADPLGPDNKLVFALGPVTGIQLPGSARHCIACKSPLSGGVVKSEVGEFWGSELKRAGYDVVIIEGKAEKPVYLWINDGKASIKDAGSLWGQNTKETQAGIRDELGDNKVKVASIGPGGEKLVRYASIMHGLFDAAARGGPGAVMGSKNLKAIAVRGHKAPKLADPEKVKELRNWMLANLQMTKRLQDFGTGATVVQEEATGNLPVRNWRDGLFPQANTIDAQTIKETMGIGMEGCFACPVRCKKIAKFDEPYPLDPDYGAPEYETMAALGSNCGVDNIKAIVKGNELCNAYSLDTISAGGAIALAMECFEKGLLTTEDTGGIELKFGNDDAMLKMIELIARREGIGDMLAEGTARVAKKIGRGAEEIAVHVKGVDPGLHEPRLKPGLGLAYMVNPHGADHCTGLQDIFFVSDGPSLDELKSTGVIVPVPADDIGPRKVALSKAFQAKRLLLDCLVTCLFLPYSHQQLAELTAAVTGWSTGVTEQLRVTERVLTLGRLINLREGLTAADDVLPPRYFQPKTDGPLANTALDPKKMEKARSYYYTLMGWDAETGEPTPERLEELGITE